MKSSLLLSSLATIGGLMLAGIGASAAADTTSSKDPAARDYREYLLTVTRPNQLQVIDMASNSLLRSCDIPGPFGSGIMVPATDGKTAYVITNIWEDVVGIDIRNCEITFHAAQSSGNETVKSFQSVAVSQDGQELYTVQNPVRLMSDHYEVLEPRLAVFEIADGVGAQPVRTFPVDRRITKIAATGTGEVILGGGDLQAINPETGEIRLLEPLQNWDRGEQWMTPDAFAMHTQGSQANEYIMPYSTARFTDDEQDMATAEWWWGISRVDLETAESERMEIAPLTEVIMNFVTDPTDDNTLYGVFNSVSKIDISAKTIVKEQPLDHTYYTVNVSRDGNTVYAGGTSSDISVHDAETLEQIASIQLPGDMSTSDMRVAIIHDTAP
ncbi:quinohemoprotein amine dehydrogenase subunit beta [Halomonas sp. KAO]|nr:quinohemoprotein amine dehydrogenase subunit beta [Halomonas sp. KAO]